MGERKEKKKKKKVNVLKIWWEDEASMGERKGEKKKEVNVVSKHLDYSLMLIKNDDYSLVFIKKDKEGQCLVH